ncbi:MAG: hypothetical protein HYR74_13285 [Candidatus Eisenbacteria bacterium]|nr:hypothetical protein [Candidatus Eisenbacteria bacterium]
MITRHLIRSGWIAALLLALALPSAFAAPSAAPDRALPIDDIGVPVRLDLGPLPTSINSNQTITVQGRVSAFTALANVRVMITSQGSARLQGIASVNLGSIGGGGSAQFSLPVVYAAPPGALQADGVVKIKVLAENADTHATYEQNDGIYAILRDGVFRAAVGDYTIARINAINADMSSGKITPTDGIRQLRIVHTLPGTWDEGAGLNFPVPAELGALGAMVNRTIVSGIANDQPPSQYDTQGVASGSVTYQGNVSWQDRVATTHAAFGMRAVVYQTILGIPINSGSQICDLSGNYSITATIFPLSDTYVEIQTENNVISLQSMGSGGFYFADSPHHNDPPGGSTITENFTVANSGTGPSAGLLTCDTYEAGYLASLNSATPLPQLRVEWPGSSTTAFYSPGSVYINLRPLDRFAYDVANHEYGHYVMDKFGFQNNPGGPHNIGDCISVVQSSKDKGTRLAWGEGYPTYFGTSSQVFQNLSALNIPTLGDVTYTDTEAGNFSYSLESDSAPPASADANGLGEDNEVAVQRILWDMVDGNADNRDNVAVTPQTLFNLFKGSGVTTLSAAWAKVRASAPNTLADIAYGAITTDAAVGPALSAPANAAVVSPSANRNFTWTAYVGCSNTYAGDGFTLHFYKTDGTSVLSVGTGSTASHSLTDGGLATLVGAAHNLLWAVEGSNSASPATGPYLGENRAIVADNPPHADAGPNQTVECSSHTTTPVTLDGSGSTDPDGDALTYTWSAAGVSFNDIHAQKPIGQFHEGTTVVTLTVSDGFLTDQSQVTIKVVDTTKPVVSCPTDLTLECDSHCDATLGGVPATDAAVVTWLASFSATDVCDPNPTTTLPHPACFPLGDTPVTFTAKDADGNTNSCTRTVHVVDTTPPVITLALDRTALWPPNHKLVTINATVNVTDTCDPNPFFQLWSITSNEPDNGLGDGDTPNDIQGADYGTADTQFQLRAERAGVLTGRVYTVTYRGFDHAGNHTDATAEVNVPHDQPLVALAADGLAADGKSFVPGAQTFALVVRSVPSDAEEATPGSSNIQGALGPGPVLALDASVMDRAQALIGNTAGAIAPVRSVEMDADGDGIKDLVVWYRVADALAIQSASTDLDGPVGLHTMSTKDSWLSSSIFALGAPMTLPPIRRTRR